MKKTLADYLYDVMKEENYTSVDVGCYGILEKVMKRSGCKPYDYSYLHHQCRLNIIIHRVMATKRGQELFEDSGYIKYSGLINRPCRVIKIKEKYL